jgi:hypothetical protein
LTDIAALDAGIPVTATEVASPEYAFEFGAELPSKVLLWRVPG